jgi:peptidyl-prolyl cis-trans isomerase SurA
LRSTALASILSLLALLSPAWASSGEVIDRIVAVVNGEIITLYEVDERAKPLISRAGGTEPELRALLDQARKSVLEAMIDDMLITQEAERLGISVSDVEVQAQVRQIMERNNLTDEQFERSLILQGITRAEYEKLLKEDIVKQRILGAMVRRKVVVTEQEIKEYYESHPDEFGRNRKVRLKLIVLPHGLDAEELHGQISSGRISFDEAARKYSIGPGAQQGGDLGEVEWTDISDEWRSILEGMGPGEMSPPLTLDQRTIILQLDAKQSGERAELDEVRALISERLYRPKLEERFMEYITTLRGRAVVDVRL